MANARLERERRANRLKMVQMNKEDIVIFGQDNKFSIATDRLNSCHALAIVSKQAAILAHIAPSAPDVPEDGPANPLVRFPTGDLWVQEMLREIVQRLRDNRKYFENVDSGGVVVYGMKDNKCALPHQVDRIASAVGKIIKRDVGRVSYDIDLSKRDWSLTNKVVVLVEGIAVGQLPNLWVDDRKVELPQSIKLRAPVTASASTSR